MKISGGQWRGRALQMPRSEAVRPTQDRVREALFNLLQPVLAGAHFLDLFAGSGAVGLEALSRGAASATFLERDRTVFATLLRNLATFGVPAQQAHPIDSCAWLNIGTPVPAKGSVRPLLVPNTFSIIFADPPYLWAREHGFAPLVQALLARGILREEGFFVAECDHRTDPEEIPGMVLLRDRTYGKTRLLIWQRTASDTP